MGSLVLDKEPGLMTHSCSTHYFFFMATRVRGLTINVNMGRDKQLAHVTYMAVFSVKMGCPFRTPHNALREKPACQAFRPTCMSIPSSLLIPLLLCIVLKPMNIINCTHLLYLEAQL